MKNIPLLASALCVLGLGTYELATPASAMADCAPFGEICGGPGGAHCVYTTSDTACVTGPLFICAWEYCSPN